MITETAATLRASLVRINRVRARSTLNIRTPSLARLHGKILEISSRRELGKRAPQTEQNFVNRSLNVRKYSFKRPRRMAEERWSSSRRIAERLGAKAQQPFARPRTVSAISQSTTAESASARLAPVARAASKMASWRWALVPRATIRRACRTSASQPK